MTATWSTNRTWSVGETATASNFNTYIRDNLDWLKTPSAAIDLSSAIVTTSASLVDVTGSSVTLTSNGGGFDVFWVSTMTCTAIATIVVALNIDSVTEYSISHSNAANVSLNPGFAYHVGAKSAASHTIKMQVSTSGGTLSITGYQLYVVERGA